MRADLERVMALQPSWTARSSPAMRERGLSIRRSIPAWLESHRSALAAAIGIPVDDLLVEGRDATGLNSRVPWVRFSSRLRSPSATEGFYVVYLFDASGGAVFLSLNQGTTNFESGDYKPKSPGLVRERAAWGRAVVAESSAGLPGSAKLELNDPSGKLGAGYERGDIASVRYARGGVPAETVLLRDAAGFAEALGVVYRAQTDAPLPDESPEVETAERAAAEAAGKRGRPRAAGFRTNAEEIRIVERHAVALASGYYEARGWKVKDVGATRPYDLDATKNGRRLRVEVKGTTSEGMAVTLTDAEVHLHERVHPDNALVVVRRIALDRSVSPPRASGGELHEIHPWRIDQGNLRPISHRYTVPPTAYLDAAADVSG